MPPLRARLLGGFDLRLGDERLVSVESARARSLLGYLLLHHDRPHPRQHLAFLLWPDSSEAQARGNLRKVLHTLRHESPEVERYLEVTPRTLQWRRDEGIWVDVVAFQAAVAQADDAATGPDSAVVALRRAVVLYEGDLLEGCYDEWLVGERERFRDRYVSGLRRLTGLLADRAEYAEAIRFGRELLRSDPLQEDTYRLLMGMYDAAGDRAGAVRLYHECATTLERELGVHPSTATTEAYAALTRSESVSAGARQERIRSGSELLVGRDTEWEAITRLWRDAEGGRAQLLLVTGEAGVGKTRLVEELGSWCRHRGAAVAQARSYPTEGELPYGVVTSWLRAEQFASHIAKAGPSRLALLARLLPDLAPARKPHSLDEAEQRRQLFDAVVRTLVGARRPTLLFADDAQWCDLQSLALIHYLVRLDPSTPVLVVATARREELDDAHPLSAAVTGLQAMDRATEIALGRLTRADTEVLARLLDLDPAGGLDVYAETEGNPLFIVETVRAVREGAGKGTVLTPRLQAVIHTRVRRCSEPAAQVLGIAATVGRAFTTDLLSDASGLDDLHLVRALDELWRRDLIREHGGGYDFSHGKIRDVSYEALTPAVRRRNHLLVANALQRRHQQDLDPVSGRIASHYECAGQVEEAVAWYQRAAVHAQRIYADAEAVRLLERARELTGELPDRARLHREFEILSSLPRALVGVEGFASARLAEAQQRAVEVAGLLGVGPEPPLLRSLVMSGLCRHDFDGAGAAAAQLHASAEQLGDEGLLVESAYLFGITAFWDGAFATAQRHFQQVVDRFRSEQRGDHLLRFGHDPGIVCLSRLGNTLWFLGRDDDARRARDEAVAMAVEVGHPFSRSTAYGFAALLSIDLGEAARFRGYVESLDRDPEQCWQSEVGREAFAGYVDVLDGRHGPGIDRIRAAIGRCGPTDPAPGASAVLTRVLLAAHEAIGDAGPGLEAADEALQLGGSRIWEAEIRRLRAEFLARVGAGRARVEAELARATDVAHRQGALGLERRIGLTRSRLRLVN